MSTAAGPKIMTLAAVVIGRNEGARLLRCLASLENHADPIVYVDSGSTDGSVVAATNAGAIVVNLDMAQPFTAARARNAGMAKVKQISDVEFVQVIDGDCELHKDWAEAALSFLRNHMDVAAVSGRLRERFPDATIWNQLADREWDTPIGEIAAIGGIAVLRLTAIDSVSGYRDSLIAGEEPEMCLRLRRKGWKIWRIDTDMALHDIAMTRLSQWWQRARRYGHAIAEGAQLHGSGPERYCVSERNRALIWGGGIPALAIFGTVFTPLTLLILCAWPAQILRLKRRGENWIDAFFLTLGKIPQAQGIIGYHTNRRKGTATEIIEYK